MTENNSKVAMAAPAALLIVGAVSFGLFALLTRQVEGYGIRVLNAFTMAAAVGIIIASVFELVRGSAVLGTIMLVSGTLMTLGAGFGFMISAGTDSFIGNVLVTEKWEEGLQMCGWVWLGIGIAQLLIVPACAKVSWGLLGSQILSGVSALLLAFGLVQRIGFGDGIVNIAGYLFLVYGIYAFYTAMAFLTNASFGRKVIPI